jgi:hypothetical protein
MYTARAVLQGTAGIFMVTVQVQNEETSCSIGRWMLCHSGEVRFLVQDAPEE